MNSINICHSLSADANGVIKDLGFPTQVFKRLEIEKGFRTAAEALDYHSADDSSTINSIQERDETDEMLFKIKVHIVGRVFFLYHVTARSLNALQLLQLLE